MFTTIKQEAFINLFAYDNYTKEILKYIMFTVRYIIAIIIKYMQETWYMLSIFKKSWTGVISSDFKHLN